MGSHLYYYVVPYQSDIQAALQALREREFRAGRYNPVMPFPQFPVDESVPGPGAGHATIDEAIDATEADGARSILDIQGIAEEPGFLLACPFPSERLIEVFGTDRPSRSMIAANMNFLEGVPRASGCYVVLYENGTPDGIFFAGWSVD